MAATLASLTDRVEQMLMDTGNAIWSTDDIAEAIRQAVEDYSRSVPLTKVGTVTLAADGREVSLSSLSGLLEVVDVVWPYTADEWPLNRIRGWRVIWENATAVLYFTDLVGAEPQSGEVVRVWYTTLHTLDDLDAASATTIRPDHEDLIVIGAAAKLALNRAADLIEITGTDMYAVGLLGQWGRLKSREFHFQLDDLRRANVRQGLPWGVGWQ